MIESASISVDEVERWKEWLHQFGLELFVVLYRNRLYAVDLKDKDGFLSYRSKNGTERL
jgi:hypothetical protein